MSYVKIKKFAEKIIDSDSYRLFGAYVYWGAFFRGFHPQLLYFVPSGLWEIFD